MSTSSIRSALVWRSPALRLLLAAIPAWVIATLLIASTSWRLTALVSAIAAVTLAAPAHGLLALAVLTPFGSWLVPVVRMQLRLTEALVLAFLVALLARPAFERRGPALRSDGPRVPRAMAAAAGLLALAILCSVAVTARQLNPIETEYTRRVLVHSYFQIADWIGAAAGMHLIEGLALAAATTCLFRARPSLAVTLPAALAASAIAAALGAVWIWYHQLVRVLGLFCCYGERFAVMTTDFNAAGSYFAMTTCVGAGMAVWSLRRARQTPAPRVPQDPPYGSMIWFIAAAICAIGLWFTWSRAAIAAAELAVVGGAVWYAGGRLRKGILTAAIAIALLAVIGVVAYRLHQHSFGVDFRRQFYSTSFRMIAERPVFGVGVGLYYLSSPLFFTPHLAATYGFENAHNNVLQIAGELGLPGLALFLAFVGGGFVQAARALTIARRDARLLGVTLGAGAFAGTWLAGHPLLVDEVAFPFWILFGLMLGLAQSTILTEHARRAGRVEPAAPRIQQDPAYSYVAMLAALAAAVVGCAVVGARQGPPDPSDSRIVTGLYEWQTDAAGTRFRWTEQYASLFVPADVVRVSIPVRAPGLPRVLHPLHVDIVAHGELKSRTEVGDAWTVLDIRVPDATPPARFKRIDLRLDRTWQPALYIPGNAEMRHVGVQVGEITMTRGR